MLVSLSFSSARSFLGWRDLPPDFLCCAGGHQRGLAMASKMHGIENWILVPSNLSLLSIWRNLHYILYCFPTRCVFLLYIFNVLHSMLPLQRSGGMLVLLAKLAPLRENPHAHSKQMRGARFLMFQVEGQPASKQTWCTPSTLVSGVTFRLGLYYCFVQPRPVSWEGASKSIGSCLRNFCMLVQTQQEDSEHKVVWKKEVSYEVVPWRNIHTPIFFVFVGDWPFWGSFLATASVWFMYLAQEQRLSPGSFQSPWCHPVLQVAGAFSRICTASTCHYAAHNMQAAVPWFPRCCKL